MSQASHCPVDASAAPRGLRSMAKAFALSLGVHAVVIVVLWQAVASQRDSTLPMLRVELSPAARPVAAAAAAPAPRDSRIGQSERARTGPPERRMRTHAAATATGASKPAETPDTMLPAATAPTADAPPATESTRARDGALPLDLRVIEWLAQYRTYPLAARRARIEGVVQLRVTLLPDGRLVDARVEQSSGHPLLDQAALDLLAHAAPLPSEFGGARSERIELQLPIVYRMRASST